VQLRQPVQRLVLAILAIGLAACQLPGQLAGARPPELNGHVRWTLASLHTAATIDDIQTGGTIALVDPASHKTLLATQAATGTGNFSFPFATQLVGGQPVTLAPGYYWLEAARYISGSQKAGVTLRTILHYTGSGWSSISGTDVQISPLTTAIARVRALDPVVTDAATIGAVVAPHQVVAPLVTYSPAVLNQLADEISATVTAGGDGAGDLPLPATVTPATGTPGITQLLWTGIPLAFDFHTQLASGQDGLGAALVEMSPAALGSFGWTSTAPASLTGPVQLRLQTGTARTLAQTWTPLTASTLSAGPVTQVTTTDGPSGPLVAWKEGDNKIRVAAIGSDGLATATVLGTGGDALALASSASGRNHVLFTTGGVPYHFHSNGASWSVAQPVSSATATISDPALAADGQGGVWAAWLTGGAAGFDLQVSRWNGSAWLPAEVVATRVLSFALAGGPEPQLAWVTPGTTTGTLITYSRRAFGSWVAPTTLSADGREVGSPVITLDAAGQPHVLWLDSATVAAGQKSQALAFRALQAGSWIAEERLYPSVVPVISRAGLTLDPFGVPLAYWLNGSSPAMVQISRRTAAVASAGSWGRPVTLERTAASDLTGVAVSGRHWLLWQDAAQALRGIPVVW
jgi:hypothetical protein